MKCPDYGGNMNRGISPTLATAILLVFVIGMALVVSVWIEEHYLIKIESKLHEENWICVEHENKTFEFGFRLCKKFGEKIADVCFLDDNSGLIFALKYGKGWEYHDEWVENSTKIDCPRNCLETLEERKEYKTEQTCIKEGLNCRNQYLLHCQDQETNGCFIVFENYEEAINYCEPPFHVKIKTVCEQERDAK